MCLQIPAGYWDSIKDSLPSTSKAESVENGVPSDNRYIQNSGIEEEEDEDEVLSPSRNEAVASDKQEDSTVVQLDESTQEPQNKKKKVAGGDMAKNASAPGELSILVLSLLCH